jgi:hypothetical protein
MRVKLVGVLLGLGLLAGTAAPSLACAFHDQQASAATQQQTADAQGTTSATQ